MEGQVVDAVTFVGLTGWCIDLTGTDLAGNPITGSVLTDASGSYAFSGLPAGTYTVCEEIQTGSTQTYPPAPQGGASCPAGFGWQSTLRDGFVAQFNDFRNVIVTP
ncbi:MAG: hypothetical protein DMD33_16935 [Gemmatimonadetes bacterium]|nr:MAG: hypothetical protein DMD33_16935 [Gemmatimonadota bacterium]PYO74010.1 MAG: hypothetical protein DMD67_14435 [Gemmatimonadota bacterium]